MNKNFFTYKKSGVDINAADNFVKFISNITSKKKAKKKISKYWWIWINKSNS